MFRRVIGRAGRRLRLFGCALERLGSIASSDQLTEQQPSTELPEWEKLPAWLPAESLRGWNNTGVSDTQEARWREFSELLGQPGPLGISIESSAREGRENLWPHNLIMTYGYVLGRVLQGRVGSSLRMLDWGSGAGHYHEITRTLFPQLRLDYSGFDLPALVFTGRRVLPGSVFFEDSEKALSQEYEFVLAGSSLWYASDWKRTLRSLAHVADPWIYLTRMIFIQQQPTCAAIQRPWRYGYDTEYQCWILNQEEFLQEAANCGLRLEREFYFGQAPQIVGLPETGAFRGFLFRRC
jgi:putative methyltransferase (TIGR04325 family)